MIVFPVPDPMRIEAARTPEPMDATRLERRKLQA